jgi:hypothetical protein
MQIPKGLIFSTRAWELFYYRQLKGGVVRPSRSYSMQDLRIITLICVNLVQQSPGVAWYPISRAPVADPLADPNMGL